MTSSLADVPEACAFHHSITVRIADVNYGGHLGNDAVLSLLHEARLAFLAGFGHSERDCGGGVGLILREWHLKLLAQAHHGDVLQIGVAMLDLRRTGFDLGYRVTRESDAVVVAKAVSDLVFFDYERARPVRKPEGCRLA